MVMMYDRSILRMIGSVKSLATMHIVVRISIKHMARTSTLIANQFCMPTYICTARMFVSSKAWKPSINSSLRLNALIELAPLIVSPR